MRFKTVLPAFCLLGAFALATTGCDENTLLSPEKLAPPLGLRSVTGNGKVTLRWQASNYGENRAGFKIYQANGELAQNAPNSIPVAFGSTPVASVTNSQPAGDFVAEISGLTNGSPYSFLVTAFKGDGVNLDDQSNPSNIVTDRPRQESAGVISMFNGGGSTSYLDLANPTPSGSNSNVDIQCESFTAGAGQRPGIVGANGARIQDMGFVSDWDSVDKAPLGANSYPNAAFSVQALAGHAYAVITGDGHYGKLWLISVDDAGFDFTCRVAYQTAAGNNELAPGAVQK